MAVAYSELKEFGEDLYRCIKCGSCRSVCPVFSVTKRESSVARGKLALIEEIVEKNLPLSKRCEEIISLCLGCSACVENCSNSVRAVEIIQAAKATLINIRGINPVKKFFLRHLLNISSLIFALLKTGSFLQSIILKRIPGNSGLKLRFSLPYLDKERYIPPLAKRTFLEIFEGKEIRVGQEIEKVGYFVGCVTNYLYPEIGEAVLRQLLNRGVSVLVFKGQGCCGLPAYGAGDIKTFRELSKRNIDALEKSGVQKVIISCSSCAFAMKKLYQKFFSDSENGRRIIPKFIEISEYLYQLAKEHPEKSKVNDYYQKGMLMENKRVKITFHDPCHLKRELGIIKEPRALLSSLPEVSYVEMSNTINCCGSGGIFNLTHYNLSLNILERKITDILSTGAEIVVTNCSGCILQLKDGFYQKNLDIKVIHLVEAIEIYS